jgi:L,D-transpeptidase ErfK/SrfK
VKRLAALGCVVLVVMMLRAGIASAAYGPSIIINLASRTLSYYTGDVLVKEYPIAIGKPSTPSPLGKFEVIEKVVNPWWYPTTPGLEPVSSGPENPLGYRWIGFASTYGVHGTNMPWSIGTAASNGCIRMFEEDVEELFPRIAIGTPVLIRYDTIRVMRDQQGFVSAIVYEDTYGYGTTTAVRFRQKLADIGAEDLISNTKINDLLNNDLGQSHRIGRLIKVKFNDKPAEQTGMIANDIILIPYAALGKNLGLSPEVNYNTGSISWQGTAIQGELRKNGLYLKLWDLCALLGAECSFDNATATANIEMIQVTYNGKPLPVRTRRINGIISLPLQALLSSTGLKAEIAEHTVTVAGRKIPAVFYGDVPFLQITQIQDALGIYVYYDTANRSIALTYIPFVSSGP